MSSAITGSCLGGGVRFEAEGRGSTIQGSVSKATSSSKTAPLGCIRNLPEAGHTSPEIPGLLLTTPRLVLREAKASDVVDLAAYQRDPRFLEHYDDRADAEEIIRLACQWATASPRLNYQLIIAFAAKGAVVGCAGLRQLGYPGGEAEVGIELSPRHWGSGYASESLAELIRFAQHELALAKLWAITSPSNHRAHRLLRRMGFSPEPSSSAGSFGLSLRPGARERP